MPHGCIPETALPRWVRYSGTCKRSVIRGCFRWKSSIVRIGNKTPFKSPKRASKRCGSRFKRRLLDFEIMKNVLCLILGGGRGSRLYPLTLRRSEPALPIAGKYRLIDIPVSNCLNSGINRIYVFTQFLSASLHRHIANTYKLAPFSQGFVEVLAAEQTNERTDWFKGTADALRQQIRHIESDPGDEILILYSDQLYIMDFRALAREHREHRADLTLAVIPVAAHAASSYGVVRVDDEHRVVELVEKPQVDTNLERLRMSSQWLQAHGCDQDAKPYLANMGIYLCRRDWLLEVLRGEETLVDFVHHVLPRVMANGGMRAHVFNGYWEDLGTIRSYYDANLGLLEDDPAFNFHSSQGVIYTRARKPAGRPTESGDDQPVDCQ